MLSLDLLRKEPELTRDALERRGEQHPIDKILATDQKRRTLISQADSLRATRNEVSKTISHMKGSRTELIAEMRQVGERISTLDQELKSTEETLDSMLLDLPNLPGKDVPDGSNDADNVVIRTVQSPRIFDFDPMPHWDIGERLGILDFQRGVKLSGSRFYILLGQGAALERALINFMLD